MSSEEALELAKIRYDAHRAGYICATPEARARIDGDHCHDVALDYRIDPDEFSGYIERVDGYRPNPWLGAAH